MKQADLIRHLREPSPEQLPASVRGFRVQLGLDPAWKECEQGRLLWLYLVIHLGRTFPYVHLINPGPFSAPLPLTESANPKDVVALATGRWTHADHIKWVDRSIACDVAIWIGAPPAGEHATAATIVAAADGWGGGISRSALALDDRRPVYNPVGAHIGACLAAAEAFKYLAATGGIPVKPNAWVNSPLWFSGWDYQVRAVSEPGPKCRPLELGETWLVGCGAIGNGFLATLMCYPEVKGVLHLVDNDSFDDTNLHRYMLAQRRHVGQNKAEAFAQELERGGVQIKAHPLPFQKVTEARPMTFDMICSAVDSPEARADLQSALPRVLLNGATGGLRVQVSRHRLRFEGACLYCLYLPRILQFADEIRRLAHETGLSESRIRELLQHNGLLSADDMEVVSQRWGVPFKEVGPFQGQPLRTLLQQRCGMVTVAPTDGNEEREAALTVSFASGLAGALMAGEVYKERLPPSSNPSYLANHWSTHLLFRPLPELVERISPDESGKCICADPDVQAVYRQRFM